MKLNVPTRLLATACLMVCGAFADASAGVITSAATFKLPGFSTGILGPLGFTPAPNNDNAPSASQNVINSTFFFNSGGLGIADLEFNVGNSAGTTEYRFTQAFINNTGQAW